MGNEEIVVRSVAERIGPSRDTWSRTIFQRARQIDSPDNWLVSLASVYGIN